MNGLRDLPALLLYSGGQDSSVCLLQALDTFAVVHTVGFAYGQRHNVEMQVRSDFLQTHLPSAFPDKTRHLGLDHVLDLTGFFAADNALTSASISPAALRPDGLPAAFVPGRNLFFFTAAAALAKRLGVKHLIGGMCETDYSGYPDCRDDTLKSLQVTLSLGMGQPFVLHTPLMWLDKPGIRRLTRTLGEGADELIRQHTHTCYNGVRDTLHDWGYGCGTCPACLLRAKAWRS